MNIPATLSGQSESVQVLEDMSDAMCVHEMIQERVDANPDESAVSATDGTLTYAALDARANQLAAYLRALGVEPGKPVGICLPRNLDLVVSLLAVLKVGAHYVPLDPQYPIDRIAYILQDSGAGIVIASSSTENRLPPAQQRAVILEVEQSIIAQQSSARVDVIVSTEQLAYVLHTSGSTGQPKGVMVPHRALANLLRSMAYRPGLTAADAIVAVTTLSFDIAGLEIWLPLIVGARVVIAPRFVVIDGHALTRLVNDTAEVVRAQNGRVMLQATPATWRLLLDSGWTGTEGLRMLCGGEAWGADLASALLSRGESLWNMYGPTETTIWSSVGHVDSADSITLGAPVFNTSLMVLDPHGSPVPPDAEGELFIGGDGVALGYLNRPTLTAEKFVPDPFARAPNALMYRTGDLVRRGNDGSLKYLSRIDQQVKLRGFRIELGEIEAALVALTSIAQAVVVIRSDGTDARLVAYVIATDTAAPPENEVLRDSLRRELPEYMVPLHYSFVHAFPLTPNGKIDRRALAEPLDADAQARFRGQRIELEEIELAIRSHAGIADAIVMVREDMPGDQRLVAYLFAANGVAPTPNVLRDWLSQTLAEHAVPTDFVFLDQMPFTASGQVDRKLLPAPAAVSGGVKRYEAPRSTIEHEVAQIFQQLLSPGRPFSVFDDFFDSGGHSLLAVKLIAEIERVRGVRIPLATLFTSSTVEELAAFLSSAVFSDKEPPLVALQATGTEPAIAFVHGDWTGAGWYVRRLAPLIAPNSPFYVLPTLGAENDETLWTIESMAARQITELRKVQPIGPYRIFGFCIGGIVAFEMACQLRSDGQTVERLVLIDSSPINARFRRVAPALWLLPAGNARQKLQRRSKVLSRMRWADGRIAYFKNLSGSSKSRWFFEKVTRTLPRLLREVASSQPARNAPVGEADTKPNVHGDRDALLHDTLSTAASAYLPSRYEGIIEVCWAQGAPGTRRRPNPGSRWRLLARNVKLTPIESGHIGLITNNLHMLADVLRNLLNRPRQS